MKRASIGDFLTEDDTARVKALADRHEDTKAFVDAIEREVIRPNMDRINTALGQENDARYLAYAVAHAFLHVANQIIEGDDAAPPGKLWEWAEDKCLVCGQVIGIGLRFMHVGMCDRCAKAPKH